MTSRVATAASGEGGSGRAIIRSRFLPTRPVASEADSSDSAPPSSPAMEVRAEATWETPSGCNPNPSPKPKPKPNPHPNPKPKPKPSPNPNPTPTPTPYPYP